MKKTVLGVVWLVAFGFGAAADEPKTEEIKKKALDKALETFTGTWEIVGAKPEGIMKTARELVFRKNLTYACWTRTGRNCGREHSTLTRRPRRRFGIIGPMRSRRRGRRPGNLRLDGDNLKVACVGDLD